MKVSEIMSGNLATIGCNATLHDAAQVMASADVGSLPVVDAGRLVGVVTDRDIVVRGLAKGHAVDAQVSGVMTADVLSVDFEDPVSTASELMEKHQVRRIYVTRDSAPCGVVSLGDVAKNVPAPDSGEALRNISKS